MGKKRGKKGLSKMSEEERARYLQHLADIAEEARRRKQQLIALYMKNKLKREEAFTRLNLAKINDEWRSILRQIKCQELKNEITQIQKLFEESLEQKDRIIRRYLNDLDESEDIYSTLQQSHAQNVDRLIGIQKERMQHLKNWFCNQRDSILNDWKSDSEKYGEERERSLVELECVHYALEMKSDQRAEENNEEYLNKMDDLKSSMTIKLEEITKSREMQLEELWGHYQNVLDDYVKYTESFYSDYSELRNRDDENTRLIRSHCYEIAKASENIAELKLEYECVEEEHQFQVSYLDQYKKNLSKQHTSLKEELERVISFDDDQFKTMVVSSHNAIQFLETMVQKGETILQLASTCRKYETEREKILPFGFRKIQMLERSENDLKMPPEEFKQAVVGIWLNLENFWIRVNNVKLDVIDLKEEKSLFEKENAHLKRQLKDTLTTLTLSTGNNLNAEKHLQRRPHSMKVEKVVHIDLNSSKRLDKKKIKRRPVTCIEANLSNVVRAAKLNEGRLKPIRSIRIENL